MAGFGRSNSLSINTSGSLFGSNNNANQGAGLGSSTNAASQPQSTGGLFGSTSTQPQTGGGLFGGGATSQQPQQGGGLFGGGQNNAAQPQSTGLFGSVNKPAASAAPSGGLFGSSTAQSQPQQSGGLFGGTLGNTQNQTQQAQPSQSGGLFGGLGQQAQAQKPGLFGASTAQQSTAPLFGSTQTAPAGNLFGSTQQNQQNQQQQQQQQQGGGLFGGSQNNMSFANNSTAPVGQSHAAQMQRYEAIKGTQRFNELDQDVQESIIRIDELIQGQVETIAPDVVYVENFLSTVQLGLDNDAANIASLKTLVKKDAEDAYLSFRAIENQALPPQFRYGNASNLSSSTAKPGPSSSLDDDDPTKPVDLVGYFNRRTQDLGNTLDLYQRQIREIETHLRTMEAGTVEKAQQLTGSRSRPQDQRRELVGALQAIEGAILDSAKKVGKVRDEVTKHTMGSVGAGLL